jgi:NAD(P)-dependent dehydrogenase (short-subunit alcohol dehydrogenase family)
MEAVMGRLEGKVALVTGASQGIGRAIARRYVAEGASVVLADINEDGARALEAELGSASLGVRCDVSSRDEVEHAFDRCIEQFGTIDILVNNAGITFAAVKHFLEMDEAFWDGILATNLKGHYLCAHRVAREMVERQSGVIINMSSGGGTRSHRGMVAYDAAKGGIEALTRALALDLGPYGIRVMCLVPGMMVETRESADPGRLASVDGTVPLGRAGLAEDMAGPAVFAASDDAAYMTGSKLYVDGGVLFQQRPPQIEMFGYDEYPRVGKLA